MYNPEYNDPYGTNIYETEEERRRRLAEEAEANMPVKQTITYDPKTGAQKVKIEGGASNLTSANPATPTVSGPVSPDDIYNRMIQAESGGRQFNAQGGVLTSPAGAMGVGQVMPSTAMQPGYGVTNIFDLAQQRGMPVAQRDEATARQLLGNEQLNREFGQSYFNAMQQRFPGQPEASVAAYNAGPGRVGQNMQANAGQLNRSQLPNETQAYIQSVLNRQPQAQAQAQQPQPIINDQGQVVGAETPAQMVAGAQTNAPIAPVQPGAQPNMMQTQAPVAQPGAVPEQMGPSTQFMSQPAWIERFNTAQGDIGTMSSMLADPNLPKGAQMEIAASMADQMRFQKMEAEKREQYTRGIETGKFPREDRKAGTGEGSWLRYFMYGLLGSPSADIEKQRLMPELYAKPAYITLTDGQTQAVIMRDNNGTAIRGTTADGRALTQKELIENAPSGGATTKVETGLVDNITGKGGYTRKVVGGNIVVEDSAGKRVRDTSIISNLRNVGVEGTQAERLENTKVKNAFATLAKDIPTPTPQQTYQYLKRAGVSETRIQQELAGTGFVSPEAAGTPTGTAAGTAQPSSRTTSSSAGAVVRTTEEPFDISSPPVARPGETKTSIDARTKDWNKKKERLEKDAEALPDIEGRAKETLQTMDMILNHEGFSDVIGMPNVLTGIYSPPSTDARNFKNLYKKLTGEQFLRAYDNLRGAGAITEQEGLAAKEAEAALQDPRISEAEFRRNAKIYTDTIKRGINRQRAKIGLDPAYPGVPELTNTGEGKPPAAGTTSTNVPYKVISQ